MRKIFYMTGTRADYGLIRKTLLDLNKRSDVDLSIIVTGMHLCKEFGQTVHEIEKDCLNIGKIISYSVFPQTGATMALGISKIIAQCVYYFSESQPDVLLVLGDRGEMLAATIAAIHMGIPVVHIHGGERSGTIDESIRHAISKLAHYHFTTTKQSKKRLVKMGEKAENIFIVGAPGLDGIKVDLKFTRQDVGTKMGMDTNKKWIIFLMHPVVQDLHDRFLETKEILEKCLNTGSQVIALMPNSDAGGHEIRRGIESYKNNKNIKIVTHVERDMFLSLLACCDLLIGNSSSGIIEAASFGIPVINIGKRQNLRERNENVVDVDNNAVELEEIVKAQLSHGKYKVKNIYAQKDTRKKIINLLTNLDFDKTILNKFNAY